MKNQKGRISRFIKKWENGGRERQDTHPFWEELIEIILGIEHGRDVLDFEKNAPATVVAVEDGTRNKYIDVYVRISNCVIEQKSSNVHLTTDKTASYVNEHNQKIELTALQQAKLYYDRLNKSEQGRYYIVCNFDEFIIVDNENKQSGYIGFRISELYENRRRLFRILSGEEKDIQKVKDDVQDAAAKTASGIIKNLYELLLAQYKRTEISSEVLHQLNVFCVRVVFCLYADDAELFDDEQFHSFLKAFPANKLREKFKWLFYVLDRQRRPESLDEEIKAFPHVNGGLFRSDVEIPRLTEEIRQLLLNSSEGLVTQGDCSTPFHWSDISPTNFGCIFESTIDAKTRRSNGMHYTSPKCIHRVIDPLFLNDLTEELNRILEMPYESKKQQRERDSLLHSYHKKIASVTFLDPACGSGNFLTETFKCLRRLEISVLKALPNMGLDHPYTGGDLLSPLRVSIRQFYGIEIVDFAAQVARAALWISDCQMMQEAEDILNVQFSDKLPLTTDNDNILCADALTTEWQSIIKAKRLTYIIGNPPFEGSKSLSEEQKASVATAMSARDDGNKNIWKNYGTMDFVCAWYAKAADYMIENKKILAAFVSTNSIVQGEHVSLLWRPLVNVYDLKIPFAWRSFVWDNEANVHCVIIAFQVCRTRRYDRCYIYRDKQEPISCDRINSYLMPAEQIFIEGRKKPICEVPEIGIGNKPIDDGNYLFTKEEMLEFVKLEPPSKLYFKPWYGSEEFLNSSPRYCLWLGDCQPNELDKLPLCKERIKKVREFRLNSKSKPTQRLANTPTMFHVENMPKVDYLVIPRHSSENRFLIPMGFLTPNEIAGDANSIVPNVSKIHFSILQSRIHMAWVKTVCGRLKSDFRYSGRVVYNNFPWPKQICNEYVEEMERMANGILEARCNHPESTLAQLYNPLTMPADLLKAHELNDVAVFKVYSYLGISANMTDDEIALYLLRESVRLATPKIRKITKKTPPKAKKRINKDECNRKNTVPMDFRPKQK